MRTLKRRRFSRFFHRALLAAAFLLTLGGMRVECVPAQHEKPYALIFGTVWGPDNRPVYGVTVKIRRADDKPKKVRWEVYSDHHGEFAQRVPMGKCDYILWTDLKGFKPSDGQPLHLVEPVTVHVYYDEREDTGLHLTH